MPNLSGRKKAASRLEVGMYRYKSAVTGNKQEGRSLLEAPLLFFLLLVSFEAY